MEITLMAVSCSPSMMIFNSPLNFWISLRSQWKLIPMVTFFSSKKVCVPCWGVKDNSSYSFSCHRILINNFLCSGNFRSDRRTKFHREREFNLFPGKNTNCYLRLCHKAALMRSIISCSFSLDMDTS